MLNNAGVLGGGNESQICYLEGGTRNDLVSFWWMIAPEINVEHEDYEKVKQSSKWQSSNYRCVGLSLMFQSASK